MKGQTCRMIVPYMLLLSRSAVKDSFIKKSDSYIDGFQCDVIKFKMARFYEFLFTVG